MGSSQIIFLTTPSTRPRSTPYPQYPAHNISKDPHEPKHLDKLVPSKPIYLIFI